MAASLTIYCLEEVTDYFAFERLCHDVMTRCGYPNIDPLGGSKDRGRDAIHVSRAGETTLFAYSVREDWRAKLAEDAHKIYKHGHQCDKLVFVTSARFSAGERDEAKATIKKDYGWELDLFGVERLRVLLDSNFPDIKPRHPQIFPPGFLAIQSGQVPQDRRHLIVSYAPSDLSLAGWLARRLTAEGYEVWAECLGQLSTEAPPADLDEAIRDRAFGVVALYSRSSLTDSEVVRQRAVALSIGRARQTDFLMPLDLGISPSDLDRHTASLRFISFAGGWADGLRQLLDRLEAARCPKPLLHGRSIAAESYLGPTALSNTPEMIVSNCLPAEKIPDVVYLLESSAVIPRDQLETFEPFWSFRTVTSRRFLSFQQPPPSIVDRYNFRVVLQHEWRKVATVEGIVAPHLMTELVRKALVVKCQEKKLAYCPDTKLWYFPMNLIEHDRLFYTRPDGTRSFVQAAGQRKYWRPTGSQYYRYHLAPTFNVLRDVTGGVVALLQVRIRFSAPTGELLPKTMAQSRRKHLCKDWWNREWLARTLALSQYLATENKIAIGDTEAEQIVFAAAPVTLTSPVSIDEGRLGGQVVDPVELGLLHEAVDDVDETVDINE